MAMMSTDLTQRQFKKIGELIYNLCGIDLKNGKEALVRARLAKRVRALRMGSIKEYIEYIESDNGPEELSLMVDAMTTNKTSFFREVAHFDYLGNEILPGLRAQKMRFWSAACSSGEEPFSLAIFLREKIPDIDSKDVLILATDISSKMLETARKAIYREEVLRDIPRPLLTKYFIKLREGQPYMRQVKDNVRAMVRLAWLNLMDPWPMKGPFNVIFCRNVMIYFDSPTQQRLVNRFWGLLEPGGYLFVGHSEGLSSISHKFKYVRPATYRK